MLMWIYINIMMSHLFQCLIIFDFFGTDAKIFHESARVPFGAACIWGIFSVHPELHLQPQTAAPRGR